MAVLFFSFNSHSLFPFIRNIPDHTLFVSIKAGALLYSLAIALLIGLLSSALILFAFFNRTALQRNSDIERAQLNANSSMQLLLAAPGKVPFDNYTEIDLFGQATDKVTLYRKHWGAFEIAHSIAVAGKQSAYRAAMVGATLHNDSRISVYLADQDKPLSLCGNTLIRGICYLPKAGVKRAYIEGQSFSGDKLIDGEIKESKRELPPVNQAMMEHNLAYLSRQYDKTDSIIDFEKIQEENRVDHTFSENAWLLRSKGKIILTSRNYSGNIIIASDEAVFVGSGSVLDNVLIYAPYIEVEDNFTGSLQLFASDSLFLGENCTLKYPSVAALINRGESSAKMLIGKGTEISGEVFAYRPGNNPKAPFLFSIEKEAVIKGQVYCSGAVDLKGSIHGSIACEKFILNTPSSVYENHLLNVTIDYSLLSPHFAGVNLTDNSENRKIVKWLY